MRRRAAFPGLSVLVLFGIGVASAAEGGQYELSVIVDGLRVPEYRLGDRTYVEAIRERNFSLRFTNPGSGTVAVAVSVDGRNVIDAKRTTALAATKWVLFPGQVLEIPGWQVSGDTARRFFFTETRNSYAQWLGDTRNVGTIEAVFFREKRRPPRLTERRDFEPVLPSSGEGPGAEVEGDVREGAAAGPVDSAPARADAKDQVTAGGKSHAQEGAKRRGRRAEGDRFAATGAGERTGFPVEWIEFEEDPDPVARLRLRYEFRPELVRLGVLLPREDLYARERGRGFEREYAPDPER